jgi:hypothetical protein
VHHGVRIADLTPLVHEQWRSWLARSYGAAHPDHARAILDGIRFGVPVDFIGDRSRPRTGRNRALPADIAAKVKAVIDADVAALKKAGPFDTPPFPVFCASPIGAVPKKDSDKIRVTHNLSFPFKGDSVNANIRDVPVSISSFGHAAQAVRRFGRGCFLVKIDIEAAYKLVPVHPDDWFLLGFTWEGKYYYERVLPFGLRSSSRLWDLYAAALRHFIAVDLDVAFDRVVIHYVDDFLFVVQLEAEGHALRARVECLCRALGVPLAAQKTLGPVTCLTFLGIELDTLAMEARLPASKLLELKQLLSVWRGKSSATEREAQSLHGMLQFACRVVRPGRYFVRRIAGFAIACEQSERSPLAGAAIPQGLREDVEWWLAFIDQWNGHSLLYELEWQDAKALELWTDACDTGYGAYYAGAWMAGRWSPTQIAIARHGHKRTSMPFLELHALVYAAKAWGASWPQKKIIFHCDCMPIVHALARGGSKRPAVMHLMRVLISLALAHNFDFRCMHIPGIDNTVADVLSRHGDCLAFRQLRPHAQSRATPTPPIPLPAWLGPQ